MLESIFFSTFRKITVGGNKKNLALLITCAVRTLSGEARFFLLVDLREFFFRFRVDGMKKKKKSSENDQLTGQLVIFRLFFFSELFFYFNISKKKCKTVCIKSLNISSFF